jgi:hypothetical protein
MTTDCLPCEEQQRLARQDIQDSVPEISEGQKASWSGPIGIEQQRTGDGRLIEANALRWDTLPVPLRWAMQDFGAHDGAYVVGKIEEIERLTYEETNERLQADGRDPLPESFSDVIVVWGSGVHDLGSEYGREAYRQVKEGLTPGISMDLDDIVIQEEDGDSFTIVEGRVRAATQVAIPAFEGARIAASDVEVFDSDERLEDSLSLMGDAEDVFNWVDDVGGLPPYIKRIEKHLIKKGMSESHAIATAVNVVKKMCATGDVNFPGSQQVNAGSRAEACAAVADWEAKKAEAKASSGDTLVASANGWTPPREWFEDPRLDGPTGLTVTDDGRVYGHIALWGTCHIANPQGKHVCTQPPRSPSNYANFHLGVTQTDDGPLATGKITMDTLHAGQRLSMVDTLHHYEHTGTVGAHVRAGEDEHGIWLAGAALPGVDVVALRAAPISGDWRSPSGQLDMVAALSVNVPGFPVPRAQALVAGGAIQSLVASGMVEVEKRTLSVGNATVNLGTDLSDVALRALRDRFREMDRADTAAALAAKVHRLAALEKVRRVTAVVGRGSFAYNPDQWRMPKGNEGAGRWIDMPGSAVGDFLSALDESGQGEGVDTTPLSEAADRASEALKAGDGEGATSAANDALSSLEEVTANIEITPGAGSYDEPLQHASEVLQDLADADLSLLSTDTDIGGAGGKSDTDIGGGDEGGGTDAESVNAANNEANEALPTPAKNVKYKDHKAALDKPWSDYYRETGVYPKSGVFVDPYEATITPDSAADTLDRLHIKRTQTEDPRELQYLDEQEAAIRAAMGGRLPDGSGSYVRSTERATVKGFEDILTPDEKANSTIGAHYRDPDGYEWIRTRVQGNSGDWHVEGPNGERVDAGWDSGKIQAVKAAVAATKAAVASGSGYEVRHGGVYAPVEWGTPEVSKRPYKDDPDKAYTDYTFTLPDGYKVILTGGTGGWKVIDTEGNEVASGFGQREKIFEALPGGLQASAAFAYNEDQWRVPKGNPEGGRWVDMPNVAIDDLASGLESWFDTADLNDKESLALEDAMDKAGKAADEASQALKAGDGDQAAEKAAEASAALDEVGEWLFTFADNGSLPEATAEDVGVRLDNAKNSINLVRDSDLSLLGEDEIGADAGGDIGADDPENAASEQGDEDPEALLLSAGISPEVAEEAINMWDGFRKSYEKNADPDEDPNPDDLEGDFYQQVESGTAPADALKAINDDLAEQRDTRANAPTDDIGEDETDPNIDDDPYAVLDAAKPGDVVDIDDGMATLQKTRDGDWEVINSRIPDVNPGDRLSDDDVYAGGDTKIEKVDMYGEDPGDVPDSEPPNGISQGEWDMMSPEERKEASSLISDGVDPGEAVRRATEDPENEPYEQGDESEEPTGSAQQKASREVAETGSRLEGVLLDAADSGALNESEAERIGLALDDLRDALSDLDDGIQGGNYNSRDLSRSQARLQEVERLLMATADRPGGMDDQQANNIGQVLDDMFARLGNLAGLLQGSTEPPPFATRKYVRQWLGRRGIRVGRKVTLF